MHVSSMISIIIPTLNEAAHIEALIKTLYSLPGNAREIIVSDGGSTDATVKHAAQAGALVVATACGRGAQLNAGTEAASGVILWFVHADARVHLRSIQYLEQCAAAEHLIGGNFRLRFEGQGWAPHLFARIARQQRRGGVYYGDSGLWVRRQVFTELGGFADWPLFEDYDFARNLENYARLNGLKTAHAPLPIIASSRRFQQQPVRVLGQWLLLQVLFSCGVSPRQLAKWYRK